LLAEGLAEPGHQERDLGVRVPGVADRAAQAQVLETKFDFAGLNTHRFSWSLWEWRLELH
jgi:hypothetical protein